MRKKSATARRTAALAALACSLTTVVGCGGGTGSAGGDATAAAAARGGGSKGSGTRPSADAMKKALLTGYGSATPLYGPVSGVFASLAPAAASAKVKVKTDKPQCLQLTQGLAPDAAGEAPAALVSMADIPNMTIAELLIAPDDGTADKVMAGRPPEACSTYTVDTDGFVADYRLRTLDLPEIGDEARGYEIAGKSRKYGPMASTYVVILRDGAWMASISVTGEKADRTVLDKVVAAAHTKAKSVLG
ncbi:hypothetical protein [Actinomadura sp. K4S16]|uniref:hypothetical protein n=1 Tax=Actinomadura sp. K4S16 TaxID=1316147 RepID=UPI0011ED61D5|nr:hypothetical protein [Actinomadura sp. K4S16]